MTPHDPPLASVIILSLILGRYVKYAVCGTLPKTSTLLPLVKCFSFDRLQAIAK